VVVATLTSTSNGVRDTSRVPSSDTSDFAETSVGLAWETTNAPTSSDTFESVTLGDAQSVDHVVDAEDGINSDFLFQEGLGIVDLLFDVLSTIDLDFQDVGLLLAQAKFADLSVGDHTDHRAVLGNAGKLNVSFLLELAFVSSSAVRETLEGVLLGTVPVLVESALELFSNVKTPNGGEGAKTTGSLNITNDTDDSHRRGLDDGDGLNDLFLVDL
jgi:hypothetical protein